MMQKQEQDFGVLNMIINMCIAASRTEEGNVDYHLYKGKNYDHGSIWCKEI
ncbi:hypothetical protein SAMN05216390_102112 [Lachnospiraceae bacterium KH1T2]|nr:hypothetical protein SAMN05216390_102112 [Lachnospiraceae bacterium KH1T2]